MSKKRPKKHYRPRAVAVPPFLATMRSFGDNVDHRERDRIYLLRVANRTATEEDGLIHVRLMQVAWILAARMENAKALRECLRDGILAVGYYSDPKGELEFTQEHFEQLSSAVETCRGILDNSGHLERAQAMTAVLDKNVLVGVDDKPVSDGEIRLQQRPSSRARTEPKSRLRDHLEGIVRLSFANLLGFPNTGFVTHGRMIDANSRIRGRYCRP